MPPLQSVRGLSVAHIRNIGSLAGLGALAAIGEDLVVWDNDALQSLTGLGAFTALEGRLWIDTNNNLTSLTGLEARARRGPVHTRWRRALTFCTRAARSTRGGKSGFTAPMRPQPALQQCC